MSAIQICVMLAGSVMVGVFVLYIYAAFGPEEEHDVEAALRRMNQQDQEPDPLDEWIAREHRWGHHV